MVAFLLLMLAVLFMGPDSLKRVESAPAFVISSPLTFAGEVRDSILAVSETMLDPLNGLRTGKFGPVWSYSDSGSDLLGYQTFRFRGGFDITRVSVSLNGVPMNELEDFGVYFNNIPGAFNDVSLTAEAGPSLSVGSAGFAGSLAFTSLRPEALASSFSTVAGPWGSLIGVAKIEGPGNRVSSSWGKSDGYRNGASTSGGSIKIEHWEKNFHVLSLTGAHENGMAYLGTTLDNPTGNFLGTDERDDFFTQHLQGSVWGGNSAVTWRLTPFFTSISGKYGVRFSPEDLATFSLEQHWLGIVGSLYAGDWTFGVESSAFARRHEMNLAGYSNIGERAVNSINVRRSWALGNRWKLIGAGSLRNTQFNYDSGDGIDLSRNWTFLNGELTLRESGGAYLSFIRMSREPARNELFGGYDHVSAGELSELSEAGWVTPETAVAGKLGGVFGAFRGEVWTGIYRSEILPTGVLSQIGLPLRQNWDKSFRYGIDLSGAGVLWEIAGSWQNAKVGGDRGFTPVLTPALSLRGSFGPRWARISSGYISSQWTDVANTAIVPEQFWTDLSSEINLDDRVSVLISGRNITGQQNWSGGHMGANGPLYFPGIPRSLWVTLNWKTK